MHNETKVVSAINLFKAAEGNVKALRILANEKLQEHTTPIPALLICVSGKATYGDEAGIQINLESGDFVNIEPNVKHWVAAVLESNFLLIK